MHLDTAVLEEIAQTPGRNAKIELLRKLEAGKELLAIALDPGVTFGVTADEEELLSLCGDRETPGESIWWDHVYKMLCSFRDRTKTGNDAKSWLRDLAKNAPSDAHPIWLARIVNKDLRCGIQLSSLLKVWPKLVEPFQVQLALEYDPKKHKLLGDWFLERKLDGLRMVVLGGKAYSRNGREITSVDHILEELKATGLTDRFVFDGEVMGGGAFDEASGKVRRKSVQNTDAKYAVFDMVRAEDWSRKMTESYADRSAHICDLFTEYDLKHCTPSGIVVVTNPTKEVLDEWCAKWVSQGYEGVMIKDPKASYQFKRSKHLLKYKDASFASEDCEIVGMVEGKGKYRGHMGTLVVKMPSGAECECGTGFSDDQRLAFWENREDLIGSIVEVRHQLPLTEEGRMRFPSFLRFRPDKE